MHVAVAALALVATVTIPAFAPAQWSSVATSNDPQARGFHAGAYAPNADAWMIYGGLASGQTLGWGHTYDFATRTWSNQQNEAQYWDGLFFRNQIRGQAMVYVPTNQAGQAVDKFFMTHGHAYGAGATIRSWDKAWSLTPGAGAATQWLPMFNLGSSQIPEPRDEFSMVWADAMLDLSGQGTDRGVVLMGGRQNNTLPPDDWCWGADGESWDVFIGDLNSPGSLVTWRQVPSSPHPPAAINGVLVWSPDTTSPSGGYFVYTGGVSPGAACGASSITHNREVWTWDGVISAAGQAAWVRHADLDPAWNLNGAAGIYDATTKRPTAIGGEFPGYNNTTFIFDRRNNRWKDRTFAAQGAFTARGKTVAIHRGADGKNYLFGGNSSTGPLSDTWDYDVPAPTITYLGVPCSQPGATTLIQLTDDPTQMVGQVSVGPNTSGIGTQYRLEISQVAGTLAMTAVAIHVGASNPPGTIYGCPVWSSAEIAVGVPVIGGVAPVTVPVPNNPALVGGSLYYQGVAAETGTGLLLLTNGIQTVLGY